MDSVLEEGYQHHCYTCRIRDSDELETVRSIAIMRRALHDLWSNGYTCNTTKEFGESIGVKDLRTATNILQRLVQEGWIRRITNKPGGSKKGNQRNQKYQVIRNASVEARLMREYFDPGKVLCNSLLSSTMRRNLGAYTEVANPQKCSVKMPGIEEESILVPESSMMGPTDDSLKKSAYDMNKRQTMESLNSRTEAIGGMSSKNSIPIVAGTNQKRKHSTRNPEEPNIDHESEHQTAESHTRLYSTTDEDEIDEELTTTSQEKKVQPLESASNVSEHGLDRNSKRIKVSIVRDSLMAPPFDLVRV